MEARGLERREAQREAGDIVLKELFSSTKRIVIKIIPHRSNSIYKLEMSHRHMAVIAVCAVIFGASMVTFQIGAVNAANAQLRSLQVADAQQRQQLLAFSKQTKEIMTRLKVLQHNEREIRKLTGMTNVPKKKASPVPVRQASKPLETGGRLVPSAPISFWTRVRSWLSGGSEGGSVTFAAESAELALLNFQLNDALAESSALRAKAAAVAEAKRLALVARQSYLDAIPSMWPTNGYVSSGFGYRSYPDSEFHPGLDIVNDYGEPVYATASGVVEEAGWDGGYGYKIVINHGNGYETWYGHNSRLLVSAGDPVRKGEEIARIGSTGFATGPHCHYQIVLWGHPIDPTPYLDGVPAQLAKM
jgi:murein DD-endopeptidase MepM/ murein hydrolase activator NlpD